MLFSLIVSPFISVFGTSFLIGKLDISSNKASSVSIPSLTRYERLSSGVSFPKYSRETVLTCWSFRGTLTARSVQSTCSIFLRSEHESRFSYSFLERNSTRSPICNGSSFFALIPKIISSLR